MMKRILLILLLLSLSLYTYAQLKVIPNLPVSSLEEAGFNQDSIKVLQDTLASFKQRDFRGLIVIKDNKLVLENYYNTFWRNHIHDIRSAGKSITAVLLGVAIKEGLVQNVDQDVYSFFSKQKYPSLNEDYKKVKLGSSAEREIIRRLTNGTYRNVFSIAMANHLFSLPLHTRHADAG